MIDPQSGVELLGDALPYADGAEDELVAILGDTTDRSSSSDALAARIHDWPTRYHLSRQRSNLLRPLSVRPGMRVLDVGAGTGALTRYLGEQGAEVVALEGSLSRARAAAVRCEGMTNVRVVCGSVGDLHEDGAFDLVLVVGVLEYAGHAFGGGLGPAAFLESIRRLVADDGVVALAIENQLGLKYLLGYAEDHLGTPWPGVEGYGGVDGVRTYSRPALGGLLEASGLPPQRWLYPYPDYKLPSVVLADRCFAQPDAVTLVDQLVRTPVVDYAHPRARFCDDRAAARSFVGARLGADVANSFLVLAGDEASVGRLVDDDVLAWHFGSERLSTWLSTKTIRQSGDVRTVEAVSRVDGARQRGWLSQCVVASEPFVAGPTVERLALDAVGSGDLDVLSTVLSEWRSHVAAAAEPLDDRADAPLHPFQRPSTRNVLPDDHVDVDLANFLRGDHGTLHYVDREWVVAGGVDLDIALVRALWNFSYRLIAGGAELPWPASTTVDELTVTLGSLCGLVVGQALLDDFAAAEDSLQELVGGDDRQAIAGRRVVERRMSRISFPVVGTLPFTALRRDVVRLGTELEAMRHELATATELGLSVEKELDASRTEVADRTAELHRVQQELGHVKTVLAAANEELAHHRARAAAFERRLLVRVYRRLLGRAAPV